MGTKEPLFQKCEICPKKCKANRLQGEIGFCGAGARIAVAHYGPHFGEEPPLSGRNGSGTIFFSPCNLRCVFCQNHQISHDPVGQEMTNQELVDIFFELEARGAHNINLVTPTPYVPLLAKAIASARRQGLAIPFVYNTNAYETSESLRILDGLVDVYLPDFKYWNDRVALMLSAGASYRHWACSAIFEMHRQVGCFTVKDGIATKGLLIRHLVLPGGLAGSQRILKWVGDTLGKETFVSLMSQYLPLYRAHEFPVINRRIRESEYASLIRFALDEGFNNLYFQDLASAQAYVPDFKNEEPFEYV